MNIRMQYLYRDAGNHKQWGEVVFRNQRSSSPCNIEKQVRALLIDREYFEAYKLHVPTLYFEEPISDLDHEWHELHSFESCEDAPTDIQDRDIEELLTLLESLARK